MRKFCLVYFVCFLAFFLTSIALADSNTGTRRVIENPAVDGDLVLRVNDNGVKTDALTVTGSTGAISAPYGLSTTTVTGLTTPLSKTLGGTGISTTVNFPSSATADQDFVMKQGTQTISGAKTFSSAIGGTGIINSTNILDGTIADGDIANTTITGGKIANTTITGGKLVNDTLTSTQIGANAITSSELASSAVSNTHVSASAAIAGTKISPDFGSQEVRTTGKFYVPAYGVTTGVAIGAVSMFAVTASNGGDTCDTACLNSGSGVICIAAVRITSTSVSCATTSGTRACLCANYQ